MRIEVDAGGATVLWRTLPLVVQGTAAGAAVLARDVTEIKRRDRALISKDATIREIHHRVKNNLQTVAALLRLQARRTNNAEGREALIESVRRGWGNGGGGRRASRWGGAEGNRRTEARQRSRATEARGTRHRPI